MRPLDNRLLAAALLSLAAACSSEPLPATGTGGVSFEEFRARAVPVPGRADAWLVDGDMLAVGEAGLRREYERYFGGSVERPGTVKSPLTVSTVGGVDNLLADAYADSAGGRLSLSYCIETGTFSAAELSQLKTALANAAADWDTMINVQFWHDESEDATCGNGNDDVFFNVRGPGNVGPLASAFFPDDARSDRELLVYDDAFSRAQAQALLVGILRHELGHVLGFRHEHIWINCTGESPLNARLVTGYDEQSVMHYEWCRSPAGGNYLLSELDKVGSLHLYGWSTPALMATLY